MTFYPQSVVVLPQSACRFSLYPQPTFTGVSQTRPRTGLQALKAKTISTVPAQRPNFVYAKRISCIRFGKTIFRSFLNIMKD